MLRSEALLAARKVLLPWGVKDEARIAEYAEAFLPLEFDVLMEVIAGVIASWTDRFPPPPGRVVTDYQSERKLRALQQPALPAPDLTPDERAENLKRARELVERYSPKPVEGEDA